MPITKLLDGLPNQSMPQAVFDAATGQFMTDLPAWGGEANALAADVNMKQIAAAASELAAAGSATLAQTAAANNVAVADVVATSATTRTIGMGDVTFSVAPNKGFRSNMPIVTGMTDFPGIKFIGYVKSYNLATGLLTMAVEATQGSGTASAWTITISGPYLAPFAAGGAASAYGLSADRVLTNASGRLQQISTSPGNGYQMPNATTLNIGPNQFVLSNRSDFSRNGEALLRDGAGILKGFLPPDRTTPAHLLESATAGGKWIFPEASPVGVAAAAVLNASSTVGGVNGTFIKAFPLDADRTMLLIHGVTLHAITYNRTLNTWGAVTLLRTAFAAAGAVDNVMAVPTATPGQLLVFSVGEGSTNGEAMVVFGGSAGNVISPGNKIAVTLGGACSRLVDFIKAGSSYVLGFMVGTTAIRFRALTTVSDTPAAGAETALTTVAPPAMVTSGSGGFGVMTASATVLTVTGYTVTGTTNTIAGSASPLTVTSAANITIKQTRSNRYAVIGPFSGGPGAYALEFNGSSVPGFGPVVANTFNAITTVTSIQSFVDATGTYPSVFTAVTGTDSSGRFAVELSCVVDPGSSSMQTPVARAHYFSAAPSPAPLGVDGSSDARGAIMTWQISTAKELSFVSYLIDTSTGGTFTLISQSKMGPANVTLARAVPAIYPRQSLASGTLSIPINGTADSSKAAAVGDGSKPALILQSCTHADARSDNLDLITDSANGDSGGDTGVLWTAYNQASNTALYLTQVRLVA